jgi:hypothetical protein
MAYLYLGALAAEFGILGFQAELTQGLRIGLRSFAALRLHSNLHFAHSLSGKMRTSSVCPGPAR